MEGGDGKISRGIANGGLAMPVEEPLNQWIVEVDTCHRIVNRSTEILAEAYVPVVCFPLLVLLCTIGNIVNFWILSKYCRPGAKQVFLLSLAVSDVLAMWATIPIYLNLYNHILGINLKTNRFLVSSFGVFTWLQYTFCYASDWILVAFSVERLTAFRFNKPRHRVTGVRTPALVLVVGMVISAAIMTSGTLIWYYHWWNNHDNGELYIQPEWVARWARLRQQIDIICPILVVLTILVINLWLLMYLKRQLKLGKGLIATSLSVAQESTTQRTTRQHDNLTRMLLGCVALYMISQIPNVMLNTLDHFSNAPYCLFQLHWKRHWEPILYTLALVNYSANFLVYVGTSAKYRRVVHLLGRGSTTSRSQRRPPPACTTTTTVSAGSFLRNQLLLVPLNCQKSPNGSTVSL